MSVRVDFRVLIYILKGELFLWWHLLYLLPADYLQVPCITLEAFLSALFALQRSFAIIILFLAIGASKALKFLELFLHKVLVEVIGLLNILVDVGVKFSLLLIELLLR